MGEGAGAGVILPGRQLVNHAPGLGTVVAEWLGRVASVAVPRVPCPLPAPPRPCLGLAPAPPVGSMCASSQGKALEKQTSSPGSRPSWGHGIRAAGPGATNVPVSPARDPAAVGAHSGPGPHCPAQGWLAVRALLGLSLSGPKKQSCAVVLAKPRCKRALRGLLALQPAPEGLPAGDGLLKANI